LRIEHWKTVFHPATILLKVMESPMSANACTPARSAAEIEKGPVPVRWLGEDDVVELLPPQRLFEALRDGFCRLANGEVQVPARPEISVPGAGFSLAMPAWAEGTNIAIKVVNVFDRNIAVGLPSHLALISLFDARTGLPVCVMDGTHITAVRTAGAAVLAAGELARRNASIVTVVGAGVQAREHLRLLPMIRKFDEIRVASLVFADAERLAAKFPGVRAVPDIEGAVRKADIICLATHSPEPVILSEWVRSGAHVSSVGYYPPRGELPFELPRRHQVFVETLDSLAPPPIGCSELRGLDQHSVVCLGDVLSGRKPGRTRSDQVTVYKAMGTAMEDLVTAEVVFAEARRRGIGQIVTL
jgi:ornithine cyclodeaminase/alanine dehydrogenase-like protein (mu-crystallin family)